MTPTRALIVLLVAAAGATVALGFYLGRGEPDAPAVVEESYEGCSACDARHQRLQRNRQDEDE